MNMTTPDTSTVTVTVPVTLDAVDLWSAVMGSGWETFSWWLGTEFLTGDWDQPGRLRVWVPSPDDQDDRVDEVITLDHITRALQTFVTNGYRDACTGRPIDLADLDFDACVGDSLMQIAVFGESIYG